MVSLEYEDRARLDGYRYVCGVDEAGRGPLAGPVCAAAVILPQGCVIEGLDDSKKLTEKKRDALYDVIRERALAYGVGMASEREIDQLNILNATFLAMKRAVDALSPAADYALVDGNRTPTTLTIPSLCLVKGDGISASIAAASVLAKVTRDRYMLELDRQYPQYQFARHKGYPTALHRSLVVQYGPSPVHRQSFLSKILPTGKGETGA